MNPLILVLWETLVRTLSLHSLTCEQWHKVGHFSCFMKYLKRVLHMKRKLTKTYNLTYFA